MYFLDFLSFGVISLGPNERKQMNENNFAASPISTHTLKQNRNEVELTEPTSNFNTKSDSRIKETRSTKRTPRWNRLTSSRWPTNMATKIRSLDEKVTARNIDTSSMSKLMESTTTRKLLTSFIDTTSENTDTTKDIEGVTIRNLTLPLFDKNANSTGETTDDRLTNQNTATANALNVNVFLKTTTIAGSMTNRSNDATKFNTVNKTDAKYFVDITTAAKGAEIYGRNPSLNLNMNMSNEVSTVSINRRTGATNPDSEITKTYQEQTTIESKTLANTERGLLQNVGNRSAVVDTTFEVKAQVVTTEPTNAPKLAFNETDLSTFYNKSDGTKTTIMTITPTTLLHLQSTVTQLTIELNNTSISKDQINITQTTLANKTDQNFTSTSTYRNEIIQFDESTTRLTVNKSSTLVDDVVLTTNTTNRNETIPFEESTTRLTVNGSSSLVDDVVLTTNTVKNDKSTMSPSGLNTTITQFANDANATSTHCTSEPSVSETSINKKITQTTTTTTGRNITNSSIGKNGNEISQTEQGTILFELTSLSSASIDFGIKKVNDTSNEQSNMLSNTTTKSSNPTSLLYKVSEVNDNQVGRKRYNYQFERI